MANTYLYRMPSGIPGDVSRKNESLVDARALDRDVNRQFPGYGLPGKLVAGIFTPIVAGDTAASVYGFLCRPFPTTSRDAAALLPNSAIGLGSIMRNGYMTVKCNAGTPAPMGAVYMRVAAGTTAKPIGGLEAAADSTNTVVLPRTYFTCAADASGNVEIEYLVGQ